MNPCLSLFGHYFLLLDYRPEFQFVPLLSTLHKHLMNQIMQVIRVKDYPQSSGFLLQLELRFKLSSFTYRILPIFLTSSPTTSVSQLAKLIPTTGPLHLLFLLPGLYLPQIFEGLDLHYSSICIVFIVLWVFMDKLPVSSRPSFILSLCFLSFLASTSFRCPYVSAVSHLSTALSLKHCILNIYKRYQYSR